MSEFFALRSTLSVPNPFCRWRRAASLPSHVFAPLLALLAALAFSSPAGADVQPDTLLALIGQRLALSGEVAEAKWFSGGPVLVPAREAEILAQMVGRASALGLPAAFVRRFFAAQMEAGRMLQQELHARWRREGYSGSAHPRDLARDLRPRLDQVNSALLAGLAAMEFPVDPEILRARATAMLTAPGVTPAVRATALAPLLAGEGAEESRSNTLK